MKYISQRNKFNLNECGDEGGLISYERRCFLQAILIEFFKVGDALGCF